MAMTELETELLAEVSQIREERKETDQRYENLTKQLRDLQQQLQDLQQQLQNIGRLSQR